MRDGLDEFDQMQIDRWERIENTDTFYRCTVHKTSFDAEVEPCKDCWNEYEETD